MHWGGDYNENHITLGLTDWGRGKKRTSEPENHRFSHSCDLEPQSSQTEIMNIVDFKPQSLWHFAMATLGNQFIP